jgi:hypothetical protein
VTFASRVDTQFKVVPPEAALPVISDGDAVGMSAIVCVEKDRVVGAFTQQQLARFLCEKAFGQGGIIDLGDYTIADVLSLPDVKGGCKMLPGDSSFKDATDVLRDKGTRLVVAVDRQTNAPLGVMVRAHRRY